MPPQVEEDDIQGLEKAISAYFYHKEGRGKNCTVEPYRRNQKEYFFAYPEDFVQSAVEWVGGTLKSQAHHPAFEIIFVYSEVEGSLDIYAPKNTKAIADLQVMFAKHILKLETLAKGQIDKRVYELAPVVEDEFEFKIEPALGIASALVTRLRVTLKHNKKERITIEADDLKNADAVYNRLEQLNLPAFYVSQVTLKVTFDAIGNKRAKTRTVNITPPNSCALNQDGSDNPLFLKTKVNQGRDNSFQVAGLSNEHWSSAAAIRKIFKDAFTLAELPPFNPHSFRNTLAALGERPCNTAEEFKAWSQNLGHEGVLTTLYSYGEVQSVRQVEIIQKLGKPRDEALSSINTAELAKALAREMGDQSLR